MKIIYVITGLGLGGAERVVVELADQMIMLGHQVKIIFLKGDVLVSPKSKKIDLIRLDLNSLNSFYSSSKKYRKILLDFKPDIVHAHMIHANIFARLNRVGCKVPKLVSTAHNSNEGGKLRMFAYKFTNFLSDLNTNVSKEASDSLIAKGAFSKNNLITVYNGIDLDKFKNFSIDNKKNKEIIFLSVGRFNEQKDYPNLLRAIFLIKNKIESNVKFYIAGDGELRSHIEQLVQEFEIKNLVHLLGKRSDIPDLLNQADYFILPSKHEGLPTVVIEAMACQTYVIATDCGGSAEIMGTTGKLISIQNSELLSQAILEVLSLPKTIISENNVLARKRIEDNFSLQVSVNNWLEIYDK